MDFTNRGGQNSRSNGGGAVVNASANDSGNSGAMHQFKKMTKGYNPSDPKWLRVMTVVLLFSLTLLAISLAALFYFGNPHESKFLNNDKVQAVFLTNGQVYFGKVTEMSPKFIDLQNIYYLNSQEAQPSNNADKTKTNTQQTNFSLVKLGCELHGPYDQMVINRDQVVFWENLRSDGQVVEAIKKWQEQNPNGQNCQTNNNSSNNNSNSNSNNTNSSSNKQ